MNIRSGKLLTSAAVAAAMAMAVSGAKAQAVGGGDPFKFWFDESGKGAYAVYDASTGMYGPKTNDPGFIGIDGFLTYALPQTIGPGDVGIAGDGELLSDGIRFFNVNGSGFMQYYSDAGGTGGAADTGFPIGFLPHTVATESGVENSFQDFTYAAGGGAPSNTNYYMGISDFGAVPEASTWAMMMLGFAGLGLAGYRARGRSTPLAV
jgi:hypothetical protein